VFALERSEAFVPTVPRINVDHHQFLGRDAEIGFGHAQAEPQFHDAGLQRGVEMTVPSEPAYCIRMLRGLPAAQATAGAGDLVVVLDGIVERKNSVTVSRPGERVREDGFDHLRLPLRRFLRVRLAEMTARTINASHKRERTSAGRSGLCS
jgi:hypothetical protein